MTLLLPGDTGTYRAAICGTVCTLRGSGCLYLTGGQLQSAESEQPTAYYIPNPCVVCRDGRQYTITPTAMAANVAFIHLRSAKRKVERGVNAEI